MEKPLLSVCLITYNQVKYIKEAIDSILAQEVSFTLELVIADDFSTDGTREVLLQYRKHYPDVVKLILQKTNVGAERNWLDLINYPKSKYIAYLEGDDYWTDTNKLQQQVNYLEKNPDYILSFHPTKVLFEKGEVNQAVWPIIKEGTKMTIKELVKDNFIPSNSVVYRRQDYSNLPIGIMPGDWYLHLYHAQLGKIHIINKDMSVYRRHAGGLWWDSVKSPDKIWIKYAVPHMRFYEGLEDLFSDDKMLRKIVNTQQNNFILKVFDLDAKYGTDLISDLANISNKVSIKVLRCIAKELGITKKILNEQKQKIEVTEDKINTLNVQLKENNIAKASVENQLAGIQNSRSYKAARRASTIIRKINKPSLK